MWRVDALIAWGDWRFVADAESGAGMDLDAGGGDALDRFSRACGY